MSEQKYYYAVVFPNGKLESSVDGKTMIFKNKTAAYQYEAGYEVIHIPAEELHALIKKHAKK